MNKYNLNNAVQISGKNGMMVVSSRQVAQDFSKRHDNVLRDIELLIEELGSPQKSGDLFIENKYQHPQNKQWYKEYLLTRDGFSLLAMGFNGKEALQWKLKYIETFNRMEESIKTGIRTADYKANLLLQMYNGGPDSVIAVKKLVEIETRPLLNAIETQKPKVDAYNNFMNSDGTYTTTNACKMLGLNRDKVFEFLRSRKLVLDKKTEASSRGIERGLFKQVMKGSYSSMMITPKGIEYLQKHSEELKK